MRTLAGSATSTYAGGTLRLAAAVSVAAMAACGGGVHHPGDAAAAPPDASVALDAPAAQDAAPALGWVDFSISGCEHGPTPPSDAGAIQTCTGPAPLTVQFTAVAPSPVNLYKWSFGDGTADDSRASPSHKFSRPGVYAVSLSVGGPGGTATVTRNDAVRVTTAALGAACTDDAQCASASCLCASDACPAPLARGICTAACDATTPCQSGVCTDLAPAGGGGEVWQASLCLPACDAGQACPDGLTCQQLRRGDGAGWAAACFAPGVLAGIGGSCVDATGAPQDDLCAGGVCAAQGARGLCTASCTGPGDCPQGATCATFASSLGSICLLRCQSSDDCTSDPWLACVAPDGAGDRGFTVDETPAAGGYCAPKPCKSASDCGTDGVCAADGYCGPG